MAKEKHIQTKIGGPNLPAVTSKYDPEYKKRRYDLLDELKYQPYRNFIRNNLAEKLVKTLRVDKIDAFRKSLGFNVIDVFNTKEQSVLETIEEVFEGENIQTQYSVLGYWIDLEVEIVQ